MYLFISSICPHVRVCAGRYIHSRYKGTTNILFTQIFVQKKRKNLHFALNLLILANLLHHYAMNRVGILGLQHEQIIAGYSRCYDVRMVVRIGVMQTT